MFDEAERIGTTVAALACTEIEAAEIVIVDDGSTDGCGDVASGALADHGLAGQVLRIDHAGKGAAVRAGAAAANGAVVGFVDADLSTDAASVLAVFEAVETVDVDVAIGSRRHPLSVIERAQPWYRTSAGRGFNRLVRALRLSTRLDTQCGLKAFTKAAVAGALTPSVTNGFSFDVEVLLRVDQAGLRVAEVPVKWRHDDGSAVRLQRELVPVVRDLITLRRTLGTVRSAGGANQSDRLRPLG